MKSQIIVIGSEEDQEVDDGGSVKLTRCIVTVDYACSTPNERRLDTVLTSGSPYR